MSILLGGSVERRVRRGAKFLDTCDPDWFNRVELDTFRMEHSGLCVIAQVTSQDYLAGIKTLGLGGRRAMWYGFDGAQWDNYFRSPWNGLRREWVRVIMARRDKQMVSMVRALDTALDTDLLG